MYDRETKTLWRQFTGEPVVGPLAESDIHLEILPNVLTTWGEWLAAHPDTTVLDINTGVYPPSLYAPEWDLGSVYFDYRQSPFTMFPVWQQSDAVPDKALVLGVTINGQAKAYPLELKDQPVVINDSLGDRNLVVVSKGNLRSARVYHRGEYRFSSDMTESTDGRETVIDAQGRQWLVTEGALVMADDPSLRLERLPSHMAYWFGWFAFHPNTLVYQGEGEG